MEQIKETSNLAFLLKKKKKGNVRTSTVSSCKICKISISSRRINLTHSALRIFFGENFYLLEVSRSFHSYAVLFSVF